MGLCTHLWGCCSPWLLHSPGMPVTLVSHIGFSPGWLTVSYAYPTMTGVISFHTKLAIFFSFHKNQQQQQNQHHHNTGQASPDRARESGGWGCGEEKLRHAVRRAAHASGQEGRERGATHLTSRERKEEEETERPPSSSW